MASPGISPRPRSVKPHSWLLISSAFCRARISISIPSLAVANEERITHSSEETIERGREIGARLSPPVLVLLSGDLGAGKTTLTKGIVSGIGAAEEDEVTSPTFTLVHKYERGIRVYHVDLYRIANARDLETL